ncbi:hypothetical protein [Pseudonocardia cypriaca]|uniref:Uncharacterized protein n=1 Tax=Pseudonocardia cypriaca TaxID=882449 RepID=A0A543FPC5_9PSEU|nr:hypothetical protein [Pseudonocardia cypriaca]TQM35687.1 hypothetical protein FB388_7127 [Pseudonocardia cypriaca]
MAEWDDLVAFVRVRFEIMRQSEGELWFRLPTQADRAQLVVVRRVTGEDDHPWAEISSPIGRVAELDLARMLERAGQSVAGGVVAVEGVAFFRHSIPFGDTALDGFDRPFRLVVDVADRLEHELTGADEH